MPSLLLAGFEGLGRAAQGLPRGMAEAEKLRQEEADRALREKAFGLQERAAQRAEEDRFVDLGQMYDTLGLPRPADTRVRTPLAGPTMTALQAQQERTRKASERAGFRRSLEGLPGTPGTADVPATGGMPVETPTSTPHPLSALAPLAETEDGAALLRAIAPTLIKPRTPKFQGFDPVQDIYDERGSLVRPGTPKPRTPIQYDPTKELRDPADPTRVIQSATPDPTKVAAENRRRRLDDMTIRWMEQAGLGGQPGAPGQPSTMDTSMSLGPGGARVNVQPRRLGEEDKKALRAYDSILAAVKELQTFTPEEVESYAGFLNRGVNDIRQFIGSIPGMGGLSNERYAQFRALSGRAMGTAFAEGGKQLTPFEASVVFTYTPTGKELGGPVEYRAKLNQLEQYTTVRRQLVAYYAQRGVDVTQVPEEIWDQQIQQAMKQAGLQVPIGRPPGAPPAPMVTGPAGQSPVVSWGRDASGKPVRVGGSAPAPQQSAPQASPPFTPIIPHPVNPSPAPPPGPRSGVEPTRDLVQAVAQELFPDVPYIQILRSSAMIDAIRGEVRARRQRAE